MIDMTNALGVIMALSFFVNIAVQVTKAFMPIPTRIWTVIVSILTMVIFICVGISYEWFKATWGNVLLSFAGSFIIAYISMYGFDTFKGLWKRFMDGENIGS